jgi:hypothetical protein
VLSSSVSCLNSVVLYYTLPFILLSLWVYLYSLLWEVVHLCLGYGERWLGGMREKKGVSAVVGLSWFPSSLLYHYRCRYHYHYPSLSSRLSPVLVPIPERWRLKHWFPLSRSRRLRFPLTFFAFCVFVNSTQLYIYPNHIMYLMFSFRSGFSPSACRFGFRRRDYGLYLV